MGPDFLCCGAQKAGTQWLFDQLQHHADFWMPPIKELHYFDGRQSGARKAGALYRRAVEDLPATNLERLKQRDRPLDERDIAFLEGFLALSWQKSGRRASSSRLSALGRRVIRRLADARRIRVEAYGRLFSAKGDALAGDITPGYSTLHPRVVGRIMRALPATKVVFIARDPVERLWSALAMHARKGRGPWPIDRATLRGLLKRGHIANRSYQTRVVARWRRYVPDAQFGLYIFDDLVADADEFRRRIVSFLGGDPRKPSGTLPADFNRKDGKQRALMPDDLRDFLGQLLADELRASAAEFGGAATMWPGKYGL